MGRRAKHKQSAPEPLEPKTQFNKKSGKRKAEVDEDDGKSGQRPTKKLKDLNGKRKEKSTFSVKNRKAQLESDGSGWEDIDDLGTHSMLVGLCSGFQKEY
jgi:ribosomal RNA methyltransferase Nop2